METITQTIVTILAAIVLSGLKTAWVKYQCTPAQAKNVLMARAVTAIIFALDVVLVIFMFRVLKGVIDSPAPLTRQDAFVIAALTWALGQYSYAAIFGPALRRHNRSGL